MAKQKQRQKQRTANKFKSKFDTFGSYTGYAVDGDEKPVQDVDDL